jgi:hypothetical protein
MKTLWRKNQENPSDPISHAWAPLNYHTYFKKQRGNLYGSGTITCKTTISSPRVYNRVKKNKGGTGVVEDSIRNHHI